MRVRDFSLLMSARGRARDWRHRARQAHDTPPSTPAPGTTAAPTPCTGTGAGTRAAPAAAEPAQARRSRCATPTSSTFLLRRRSSTPCSRWPNVTSSDMVYDLGAETAIISSPPPRSSARGRSASTSIPSASRKRRTESRQGQRRRQGQDPEPGSVHDGHQPGHRGHAVPAAVVEPEADSEADKQLKPGTRIVSQSFDMGTRSRRPRRRGRQGADGVPVEDAAEGAVSAQSIRDRSAREGCESSDPPAPARSPSGSRLPRARTGCRARSLRGSDRALRDFLLELFAERRRQAGAHRRDLLAHLFLRALSLRRQDEKPERAISEAMISPVTSAAAVRRRCRRPACRSRPRRRRRPRPPRPRSRAVGELLRLSPPIVGIDHPLRFPRRPNRSAGSDRSETAPPSSPTMRSLILAAALGEMRW